MTKAPVYNKTMEKSQETIQRRYQKFVYTTIADRLTLLNDQME